MGCAGGSFVYDVGTGHVNLLDIPKDPDAEVYGVDEAEKLEPSEAASRQA